MKDYNSYMVSVQGLCDRMHKDGFKPEEIGEVINEAYDEWMVEEGHADLYEDEDELNDTETD